MTDRLLRRPRGAVEVAADALRVLGALSIIAAGVYFGSRGAGIIAITVPLLLVPRIIGLRPSADIIFTLTLMVTAWTNAIGLYELIDWTDAVVHFACTGVLAAATYLLFAQHDIVVDPSQERFMARAGIVLTTTIGLALSAIWEIFEWLGRLFVDISVTYDDTIADMACGGAGALCTGIILSRVPLRRADAPRLSRVG